MTESSVMKPFAMIGFTLGIIFMAEIEAQERSTDRLPWERSLLETVPKMRWLDEESPIRELLFEGESYRGNPTEVFAFYATPETIRTKDAKGPFPAVVLIHGGGGTAFAEWVWLWARRGYAAIAMDLSGRRPPSPEFDSATGELTKDPGKDRESRTRLEKGGPEQGHPEKFDSIGGATDDDWPFHAVSSAVRAHSLVRSFPKVDPDRTAVTGISWGGYTTCLTASVDHRFAAAAPVYGCGFLHEGESVQKKSIDVLGPGKAEWVRRYDPSSHLEKCRVPILFVNGTHDIHYPLDSYRRSYDLVPGSKRIRIEPEMRHSHPAGWAPEEIGIFIDSHCKSGKPLATLSRPEATANGDVTMKVRAEVPITKATLHYTTDTGLRSARKWNAIEAKVAEGRITAERLPAEANTWIVTVTDERGAMVSSEIQFREK